MAEAANPKLDPHPGSNTEKDPDDWVSGDEPMTGAQASYLTTLCEEAGNRAAIAGTDQGRSIHTDRQTESAVRPHLKRPTNQDRGARVPTAGANLP